MVGDPLRAHRNINDYLIQAFVHGATPDARRERRVLDLGCGDGRYAGVVAAKGYTVIGLDRRGTARQLIGDASDLPFRDAVFEGILCTEVIEHLPDIDRALADAVRVLAPSGWLMLSCPFMYPLHEAPYDYTRLTEFGLQNLLGRHRIQVIQIARRGDLIALLHTAIGVLMSGTAELASRKSWLPRAVTKWLNAALEISYRFHAQILARRPAPPDALIGEGIVGVEAHLASWTLGYCVLGRKADD